MASGGSNDGGEDDPSRGSNDGGEDGNDSDDNHETVPLDNRVKSATRPVRFCCISDTHGDEKALGKLPVADILVHGGDFTFYGRQTTVEAFEEWGAQQPQDRNHKLLILGNHENRFVQDEEVEELKAALPSFTVLSNEAVMVDGLVIYGAPFYPDHNSEDQEVASIPSNVDVDCGHVALAKAVAKAAPKLHVFGHIHGAYGVAIEPETGCINVNAAMVGGIGETKGSDRKCQHKRPILVDVSAEDGAVIVDGGGDRA
ncbi:MAG: hypothetical protein SGARI_000951 [Bacillariaceae sp.]